MPDEKPKTHKRIIDAAEEAPAASLCCARPLFCCSGHS